MTDFDAQLLANTVWSFATACVPDAQLFTMLARAAERRMADFDAQELANTAWAFATAGLAETQLLMTLAKAA